MDVLSYMAGGGDGGGTAVDVGDGGDETGEGAEGEAARSLIFIRSGTSSVAVVVAVSSLIGKREEESGEERGRRNTASATARENKAKKSRKDKAV